VLEPVSQSTRNPTAALLALRGLLAVLAVLCLLAWILSTAETSPTRWLAVVLLLVASTLACLLFSPSFVHERGLAQASVLAGALGVLSCSVLWWGGLLALRLWLLRAGASAFPGAPWTPVVAEAGLGGALFFSALSWTAFFRTGVFLNRGSLKFLVLNFRHVLGFSTPANWLDVLGALAASTALFALVLHTAPAAAEASGAGREPWSLLVALAAGSCLLAAGYALWVYPAVFLRKRARSAPEYLRALRFRSTPGLALLFSAVPPRSASRFTLLPKQPIRPLDEYVVEVEPRAARRPDIVLVIVESLRRDSLQALGAPLPLMPFVEKLAGEGLVFTRAYAQGNATTYSTTALLSSLYPLRFRHVDLFDRLDYPRTLIYDLLARLGYRAAIFSSQNERWGNMDRFLASDALEVFFHAQHYHGPTLTPPEDDGVWTAVRSGKLRNGHVDDRVTVGEFVRWASDGPRDRPLFACINLQATHFPYQQAFQIETPFAPHELDFRASFFGYPREKVQVMRNRYWNSLRYADSRIEEIVACLDGRGREAIAIIVGDHGEEFYEHGDVTHAKTMYEEIVGVPLVFHGPPDLIPRRLDDRPVQHIDIFPTLLGLLGLGPYRGFQGRDVLDPRRDPYDHRLFLTTQNVRHQHVLIWRDFKFILDDQGPDRLFFLRADPGERRNLIPLRPDTAEECREIVTRWWSRQIHYYASPQHYSRYFPPTYR
jgi:arylsulfatase A-like enzyme